MSPKSHNRKRDRALKWPLVRVRWVDSTSPRMGWTSLSTLPAFGSLECLSVGYVIAEDKQSRTIAPHLAYPDDDINIQGNGIIVIPRAAIISCEQLS